MLILFCTFVFENIIVKIMTRFIVRIIAVIAMCAITSCEMLVDLGILPSKSLQTSHLEMLVTAEEYGYRWQVCYCV